MNKHAQINLLHWLLVAAVLITAAALVLNGPVVALAMAGVMLLLGGLVWLLEWIDDTDAEWQRRGQS